MELFYSLYIFSKVPIFAVSKGTVASPERQGGKKKKKKSSLFSSAGNQVPLHRNQKVSAHKLDDCKKQIYKQLKIRDYGKDKFSKCLWSGNG